MVRAPARCQPGPTWDVALLPAQCAAHPGGLRCQPSAPAPDLLILSPPSLGFNPMWEETLVFTVHMPEIALVRFLVWDHDPIGRDFIGQRTLAFSSMMPGREEALGWGRFGA